jgi:hypothetical protein
MHVGGDECHLYIFRDIGNRRVTKLPIIRDQVLQDPVRCLTMDVSCVGGGDVVEGGCRIGVIQTGSEV